MQSRIERYDRFIEIDYVDGLLKPHEYSIDGVSDAFRRRVSAGVENIVFTGMGCSAIVADLVRGYLVDRGAPVEVYVVNDYELADLLPADVLDNPRTVFVISSYSGYSSEPMLAFDRLAARRDQTLLLTSGGPLAEAGRLAQTSVALWQLSRVDREYPLFHVTQYFVIIIDLFIRLGLLPSEAAVDGEALAAAVRVRRGATSELGDVLAGDARDANIMFTAPPLWHDSLLKLCKMHVNEIAMVPASRNYFHEFCHSEVAVLSDPDRRQCVIFLADAGEDDYTSRKRAGVVDRLTRSVPENAEVVAITLPVEGDTFLEKLFVTLDIVQHMTLSLARHRPVRSRDLISEASGNRWYHSSTIASEAALIG